MPNGVGTLQLAGVTLRFERIDTGDGVAVTVVGGDRWHIGAVCLAIPRPSLTGTGLGADVWVLPRPGHKDDDLARLLAKELAIRLGEPVALSVGIHVEQISPGQVSGLLADAGTLARLIAEA